MNIDKDGFYCLKLGKEIYRFSEPTGAFLLYVGNNRARMNTEPFSVMLECIFSLCQSHPIDLEWFKKLPMSEAKEVSAFANSFQTVLADEPK